MGEMGKDTIERERARGGGVGSKDRKRERKRGRKGELWRDRRIKK